MIRTRIALLFALAMTFVLAPAAPSMAQDQPPQPASTDPLTNESWAPPLADATPYQGMPVVLFAKVANLGNADETATEFQAFTNLVSYTDGSLGVTYVIAPAGTLVKTDEFVRVEGTVYDMFEGINFVGATVRAPRVLATRVDTVSRDDAYGPIIRTVTPGTSQTTAGVTVTIERVEIAQRETRVSVQVRNSGAGNASLDMDGVSLVQNGVSMRAKNPSGTGYSPIPQQVRGHADARGVILFDPIQPSAGARVEFSSIRSGNTSGNPISLDVALG